MSVWTAAVWALVGGGVAEALNLCAMMRPTTESKGRWQWPWRNQRDRPIVLFAVALRLAAGSGLGAAAGAGGVATTSFATFVFGLSAPLMVARVFDQVRMMDPSANGTTSGGLTDGPRGDTTPGSPESTGGPVGGSTGGGADGER